MPDQTELQTIAIASTFTVEPLALSVNFWMEELGIPSRIVFAPYNQVFQQLLDPASLLSQNEQGVNVLLIRLADWLNCCGRTNSSREFEADNADEVRRTAGQFVEVVRQFVKRSTVPMLVVSCPNPDEGSVEAELLATLGGIEKQILDALRDLSSINVVSAAELMSTYPVADYYDPCADKSNHLPYTPTFFVSIGSMLSRRIFRLWSAPYKVIVLDCDQTLWKGACAEDGPSGVEIDTARMWLQESMVRHQRNGILLCLCSKNSSEDVFRVFETRADMPLRQEHIAASRINWNSKSENLQSLAAELQIGLDSFIFIDDSPVECAEVRAYCPEVLTLQLPTQVERISQFVQHIWALDQVDITPEDRRRTIFYRENHQRTMAEEKLGLREFLATLNLTVHISNMTEDQLPRVAQLVERTNQFNLTTIRRTESDLRKLWALGEYEFLTAEVTDRYGDYGLVGLMIFSKGPSSIVVDTFLLSCRALGRGVEHRMLANLGQRALEHSLEFVDVLYVETERNRSALDFVKSGAIDAPVSRGKELWFRFPSQHAASLTHPAFGHTTRMSARSLDPDGSVQLTSLKQLKKGALSRLRRPEQLSRIADQFRDSTDILSAILQRNYSERPQMRVPFLPPDGPLQKELAQIWSEVLGVTTIGVDDNFFDLGGHSLAAVQLTFRIRQNFGIELPLQAFLKAPVFRAQAENLERELFAQADPAELQDFVHQIETSNNDRVVPLNQHGGESPATYETR